MTGIDAVRDLLPSWVVWGPMLLTVPFGFLVALVGSWLGTALALWPFLRSRDAFWVERARLAYPGAQVAGATPVLLPLVLAALFLIVPFPLCPVPRAVLVLLAALAGYAGAYLTARWTHRRTLGRPQLLSEKFRDLMAFWLGIGGALLVFCAAFVAMPLQFDWGAVALLGLAAAGLIFFATDCGFLLGRLVGLARPASPRLQAVVDRVAKRTGIHPRGVFEVPLSVTNAWALPFLGLLAFTPRTVALLTDEELEALTAHEIAHLTEPWPIRLGRILPAFLAIPLTAAIPLTPVIGLVGVLTLVVVLGTILVFVIRLSRRMERQADESGRAYEAEAGVYARALARLYEANLLPVVTSGKGGTHPHLYDRLVAAGVPPDYDRPRPPSRWCIWVGLSVSVGLPVVLLLAAFIASLFFRRDERLLLTAMAFNGGNALQLSDLGVLRVEQGEPGAAVVLFRAAGQIDRDSPGYPANEANALAHAGRCDEADTAARETQRRYEARGARAGEADLVEYARRAVVRCRVRAGAPRP